MPIIRFGLTSPVPPVLGLRNMRHHSINTDQINITSAKERVFSRALHPRGRSEVIQKAETVR